MALSVANKPEDHMDQKPEYLSLREAAKELGVNRTWLAGALSSLEVPLMPLGQSKAVRRSDLARLKLPARRKQPVAPSR